MTDRPKTMLEIAASWPTTDYAACARASKAAGANARMEGYRIAAMSDAERQALTVEADEIIRRNRELSPPLWEDEDLAECD